MIRRITRQKRGMKEHELRKVIEALIYSRRIMYHLPYVSLTKTQRAKLETALRKATRLALGVPRYAANQRVEATGIFNSLNDRVDMHKLGQEQRLKTSTQGRKILQNLGYNVANPIPLETPPWGQLPRIIVEPIPKNMHRIRDIGRRADRVKRLEKEEEHSNAVIYYTNASFSAELCTIAVWSRDKTPIYKYHGVPTPIHAELLAIATAISELTECEKEAIIRTGSQDACRAILNNKLPTHIHNALQRHMHSYP
ncbi:unnamed protein product, partial [Ixodes hexagonus]